jgi:hypothetical protein
MKLFTKLMGYVLRLGVMAGVIAASMGAVVKNAIAGNHVKIDDYNDFDGLNEYNDAGAGLIIAGNGGSKTNGGLLVGWDNQTSQKLGISNKARESFDVRGFKIFVNGADEGYFSPWGGVKLNIITDNAGNIVDINTNGSGSADKGKVEVWVDGAYMNYYWWYGYSDAGRGMQIDLNIDGYGSNYPVIKLDNVRTSDNIVDINIDGADMSYRVDSGFAQVYVDGADLAYGGLTRSVFGGLFIDGAGMWYNNPIGGHNVQHVDNNTVNINANMTSGYGDIYGGASFTNSWGNVVVNNNTINVNGIGNDFDIKGEYKSILPNGFYPAIYPDYQVGTTTSVEPVY